MIAIFVIFVIGAFAGAAITRYALPAANGDEDLTALQKEIADLRAQAAPSDLSALDARVAALEKSQGAAGGASSGDVAALTNRMTAAEQALSQINTTVAQIQQRPALGLPNGVDLSQSALDNLSALANDLKGQVAGLSARLDALEANAKSADSAMNDRIALLEQKVPANLGDQLASLATKGDVGALDQRIATLEASTTALDAKRAAAAIALANLARAAQSGTAFTNELAAVKLLNVDPAMVAPISPYAARGVPPVSDLIAAYDGVARDALRAARASQGDWWSRLWANIAGLFLVRRTGEVVGNSNDAILARAGVEVHTGNLPAAVAELGRLKGPAAAAIADWRRQAQARVDLDRLISSLTTTLIATLSAPGHS